MLAGESEVNCLIVRVFNQCASIYGCYKPHTSLIDSVDSVMVNHQTKKLIMSKCKIINEANYVPSDICRKNNIVLLPTTN